jgi:hypothetical protein
MRTDFSSDDQFRRLPAPVNTSIRRTGSGICLCSEIDMCRSPQTCSEHHPSAASPKGGNQTSLTALGLHPSKLIEGLVIDPEGKPPKRKRSKRA